MTPPLTSAQRDALREATLDNANGTLAIPANDLRPLLDENEELRKRLNEVLMHHEAWCRGGLSCPGASVTLARAALSEETKEETNG